MKYDLKDPELVAAFVRVQHVLTAEDLTVETEDEATDSGGWRRRFIVTGPHADMRRGRSKTLLGAVRDFIRANSGRP